MDHRKIQSGQIRSIRFGQLRLKNRPVSQTGTPGLTPSDSFAYAGNQTTLFFFFKQTTTTGTWLVPLASTRNRRIPGKLCSLQRDFLVASILGRLPTLLDAPRLRVHAPPAWPRRGEVGEILSVLWLFGIQAEAGLFFCFFLREDLYLGVLVMCGFAVGVEAKKETSLDQANRNMGLSQKKPPNWTVFLFFNQPQRVPVNKQTNTPTPTHTHTHTPTHFHTNHNWTTSVG